MWYKIDFSAILGGIIGFLIMLIVMMVFWFPLAVKQFVTSIM